MELVSDSRALRGMQACLARTELPGFESQEEEAWAFSGARHAAWIGKPRRGMSSSLWMQEEGGQQRQRQEMPFVLEADLSSSEPRPLLPHPHPVWVNWLDLHWGEGPSLFRSH